MLTTRHLLNHSHWLFLLGKNWFHMVPHARWTYIMLGMEIMQKSSCADARAMFTKRKCSSKNNSDVSYKNHNNKRKNNVQNVALSFSIFQVRSHVLSCKAARSLRGNVFICSGMCRSFQQNSFTKQKTKKRTFHVAAPLSCLSRSHSGGVVTPVRRTQTCLATETSTWRSGERQKERSCNTIKTEERLKWYLKTWKGEILQL